MSVEPEPKFQAPAPSKIAWAPAPQPCLKHQHNLLLM